jgi:hypothetical protein
LSSRTGFVFNSLLFSQNLVVHPLFPIIPIYPSTLTPNPCFPMQPPYMMSLNNHTSKSPPPHLLTTCFGTRIYDRWYWGWTVVEEKMRRVSRQSFSRMAFNHWSSTSLIYLTMWFAACYWFPLAWSNHIIHLIHKLRSSADLNNYLIVMVGHTFSKLHATALDQRLSLFLNEGHLQDKAQAGFRLQYQTIDHILTLKGIIEETRHHSSKVLCCQLSKVHTMWAHVSKTWETLPSPRHFSLLLCISMSLYWVISTEHKVCQILSRVPLEWSKDVLSHPLCLGYTSMS